MPDLHLLQPPIWFCHQKFKTILPGPVCCRFLIILLLPLSCCCNAAAATLLLQCGCCNAACCFFSGFSIRIGDQTCCCSVDNTYRPARSNAVFHRAHYYSLETQLLKYASVVSCQLHWILYREFNKFEVIRRATGRFQKTH